MNRYSSDLIGRLKLFFDKIINFIPDLLVMLIILFVGFIAAHITRFVLTRVFRAVKFDLWCDSVGLASMMNKSGIQSTPSAFISLLAYWLVAVIFFMAGFSSLDLKASNELTSLFFLYLPRFFSALVIIVVGYIFAGFLGRAALLTGVNSGIQQSKLLGQSVRLLVLMFVFAMALEQLSIAPGIVFAAFSIFFGGVVLALALAFGLGGRDYARDLLDDIRKKRERNDIEPL